MSLSKKIRAKLGNLRFMNDVKNVQREPEVIGFNEAKKIGLLYDATDQYNFEVVKAYVKTVRNQQKDILALGYVDKKQLPQNQFAQFGIDFFTRKHLNWQMIPNTTIVRNFIEEQFDILINLTGNKCFPLQYIAAVSRARFRVGRFDKKNVMCYDLMIQTGTETGIKDFIEEVENCLRQIKK